MSERNISTPNKFTPELREVFFQVLEETCSPKRAAEACGINPTAARYHRKDLEFRTRWDKCIETALDNLLGNAYERATTGQSDRLLEVLLKFRYGDQMADRLAVKVEDSTGLSPDALLLMSAEDRQALTQLLTKYTQAEHRAQAVLEHDQ